MQPTCSVSHSCHRAHAPAYDVNHTVLQCELICGSLRVLVSHRAALLSAFTRHRFAEATMQHVTRLIPTCPGGMGCGCLEVWGRMQAHQ